jgi:hypothetical protein
VERADRGESALESGVVRVQAADAQAAGHEVFA